MGGVREPALGRHGDIALVQGLKAYQCQSTVGVSFGNLSDAHDLVVVLVSSGEDSPAQPALSSTLMLDDPPCINDKNDNEQKTADDSGGKAADDHSVDLHSSSGDVSPCGRSSMAASTASQSRASSC